jgi:hypothetical protein
MSLLKYKTYTEFYKNVLDLFPYNIRAVIAQSV